MSWISEKPTVPGGYWMRMKGSPPVLCAVQRYRGRLLIQATSGVYGFIECAMESEEVAFMEWIGPLVVPERGMDTAESLLAAAQKHITWMQTVSTQQVLEIRELKARLRDSEAHKFSNSMTLVVNADGKEFARRLLPFLAAAVHLKPGGE